MTQQKMSNTHSSFPLRTILKEDQALNFQLLCDDSFEQARANKILPFLVHKLKDSAEIDPKFRDKALSLHDAFLSRSKKILSELQEVFHTFDENAITGVIVVENFATIVATNGCLGCFASGDVDLMARNSDYSVIAQALRQTGWQENLRRSTDEKLMSSFSKMILGEEFYLNFEWKAVSRSYFLNEKSLGRRVEWFRHQGHVRRVHGINILANEPNLYLNCMHLSIGHYYGTTPGLRLYKDLELHLRDSDMNFVNIVKWAKEDGTITRLETCLQLYSDIYDEGFMPPVPVSARAKRIAHHVSALNNPLDLNRFNLKQQIKIDRMSDNQTVAGYMIRRIRSKLLHR